MTRFLALFGVFLLCACPTDGDGDGPTPLPECNEVTTAELHTCIDEDAWLEDVTAAAIERVPGTAGWQTVQDLCADRLAELGYEVELHDYGTGINVLGSKAGVGRSEEQVVLSAHYDHIADCEGADDNASGVAAVLELARVLSHRTWDRTLIVACWDEEELGLIGSAAFVERAVTRGDAIAAHVTMDAIAVASDEPGSQRLPEGFDLLYPEEVAELEAREFRADFIAFLHDEASFGLASSAKDAGESIGLDSTLIGLSEALKTSPLVADLRRSDHAPFWDADLPGLMVSDTAEFRYGGYHCRDGPDSIDRLDPDFATRVMGATLHGLMLPLVEVTR